VRALAACALAVALITGCDATQSAPADEAASTTTTRQDRKPSSLFPFFEGWIVNEDTKRRPVKKLYGVFRRSQSRGEAEIKPQMAVDAACSTPGGPDSARYGRTITRLGRILLSDVGRSHDVLVAVPTTTDLVTVALSGEGGTCGRPMTRDGLMIALQVFGRVAIVYGMVGDDVASVDLVVDGNAQRAQLGENGFAIEIPDAPNKTLEKLVLEHHDGSVTEFPTAD
jgi:hypothetical protein